MFFEVSIFKSMIQHTTHFNVAAIATDLIWTAILLYCIYIIYTTFYLHGLILDIVKNTERIGRKMIMKRLSLKKRYFIELISS